MEVEFFVGWCQSTGLDPFLKQAYFIERGQNVNGLLGREVRADGQRVGHGRSC